tara:strand:- start:2701 stop:3240 length:540 start_codon:yes stop_codon:yes gene_type:complete
MTITPLTTFIEFTAIDANSQVTPLGRYQNSFRSNMNPMMDDNGNFIAQGENHIQREEGGPGYHYLPFIYNGATKDKGGNNLEAQLIFANNTLTMNFAHEAVLNKWHVEVSVCLMNTGFTEVQRILTKDNWLVASFGYDPETIEVLLSSAIDAVGLSTPNRVLTKSLVGALPTTANIQNR